jgi:hypothetical protein
MSDGVFNAAKGRVGGLYRRVKNNDPTNAGFVILLLSTNETETTLVDYDTVAALLAGSNTEADFTNYARIELTDADLAAIPAPDDANDRADYDLPDPVWDEAGGETNNTLTKIIVGYVSDLTSYADTDIVPMTHHDFAVTTNGGKLTAQINASGFYRAA